MSRDEAYRLITDAWAQTNPHAKAFLDRQDSKSSSSTEESIPINKDSKEEDEPSSDQLVIYVIIFFNEHRCTNNGPDEGSLYLIPDL